jgi:hypothetical protein
MSDLKRVKVRLRGLRAIMFDRYPGDNNTKLAPEDKLYLDDEKCLVFPTLNLFSMLTAENTKSACRMFFGKQGSKIAHGIKSCVDFNPADHVRIFDDNGPIRFTGFNDRIKVLHHVAKVKKGNMAIPNPTSRPCVKTPWAIDFEMLYVPNSDATLSNIRQAFLQGGTLGLGSFRPFFGTYALEKWDVE